MSILANTLKCINNANVSGHRDVLIRKTNKCALNFLNFMQKKGYIKAMKLIHDNRSGKVIVSLNGRLVKCGAICPRFNVKLSEVENWRSRVLPARQFGHLVLSTSQGVMDQEEALKRGIGGVILGFFY